MKHRNNSHTDGPPYASYYSVAADSAATDHFFTVEAPIANRRETDSPIQIQAANGGVLESTHIGDIPLSHVPTEACRVHIVPGLRSMSLLAMGPLCDAGCAVEFDAKTVHVKLHDKLVLQGHRTLPGLWQPGYLNCPLPTNLSLNPTVIYLHKPMLPLEPLKQPSW